MKKIEYLQQQATLKVVKANILRLNASSNSSPVDDSSPVIDMVDTSEAEEEYTDADDGEKDF